MKNLSLIVIAVLCVGCGSSSDLNVAENKKMQDDLKGGMDLSKATPQQKAGFEAFMKSRGMTPGGAPSAPSSGK